MQQSPVRIASQNPKKKKKKKTSEGYKAGSTVWRGPGVGTCQYYLIYRYDATDMAAGEYKTRVQYSTVFRGRL